VRHDERVSCERRERHDERESCERRERHDERESCERRERQRWGCSPPNSRSSSGALWGEGESEWRADGRDKEKEREERLQQEVDKKWAAAHACMRRVTAELRYAPHAHAFLADACRMGSSARTHA
jgi:hypothetical protein